MHHPDPAGDSGSVKKMANPAVFHRRGSNTGSASSPTLSTPANSVVNNSHVQVDDYQSSPLIQCPPPAGSPSPGPHHPPPQSLNLLSQPQPTQSAGAQMKKKSGFQITSVTPAQISVSTNNSIAEDTESYDDLDESHTEDLSSSEILDVSLSRANDVAGAERSSSEETLNNFHEAETPGAISPNQPSHLHSLNQAPQHGGTIVNGSVHHHHHHHQGHHPHQAQVNPVSSGPGSTPSALTSGALPCVTQKMPSNVGVPQENVVQAAPQSIIAQPLGMVAPGAVSGMYSSATGTAVSIVNPQTSNVSNVNMLSSTNVPVRGGISTSASSSSGGGFPVNVSSSEGGGGSAFSVGGNLMTSPHVNMIQQHQTISSITMTTTTTTSVGAASASGVMGVSSGIQGRVASTLVQSVGASVPAVPVSSAPVQPTPAAAPTTGTTSSRFRVVKLDSSSEPFKKGRWTCTEYYDKETPASAPTSFTSEAACPSVRQFVPESFAVASEKDSGSSVSSTISTLSYYTESVGSGDGRPTVPQQAQDYSSSPQGIQGLIPSGLSVGASQTQTPLHPQDLSHVHMKATVGPCAPTSIHQPAPMSGHQTTIGHPTPSVPQQQLTYAQAVANQPPGSTQGLVGVQQKLGYASLTQQPPASPQVAPVQMRPSEHIQPHPPLPQAPASQLLPNQVGPLASGPANRAGQVMGGPQQTQALLHTQPQQTSSLQAPTASLSSNTGVAGSGQQSQSHSGHLDLQQQKPQSLPNQIQNPALGTQLSSAVHQNQAAAASVPAPNHQSDPQAQPQAHNSRMPPQGVLQNQPPNISLSQSHTAQTSALYASLPSFTTTQLEDAQRLLLQHQSALLGLPKPPGGGDAGSGSRTGQGQEAEGSAATTSALSASDGLLKAVDGEDDG
ncbi:hypothetical protein LDENG_00067280 [Lucifuga dentata]|nr:hypothetical protein LDENG_00067280 [Lucifuga dentata]